MPKTAKVKDRELLENHHPSQAKLERALSERELGRLLKLVPLKTKKV